MAAVYVAIEELDNENISNWQLIDRSNPFELPENVFLKKFRLSRVAAFDFCEFIQPYLPESNGYTPAFQVLTLLRLFGSGSFQNMIADNYLAQTSQPSISRFLDRFLTAVMQVYRQFITFPVDISSTRHEFYEKFNFPNVVGAIDCTHVCLKKTSIPEWNLFLNRKHKFSINIQMVCDAKMKIMDVVARWPGCTHDAFIWQASSLRSKLETAMNTDGNENFLLGDSGYPIEPWLLTPYSDPVGPVEELFNTKHRSTRSIIEKCFGVLKGRFRILDQTGGTLCLKPEKVCKIVFATAILHNVCIQYNVENVDIATDDDSDEDSDSDDDSDPSLTAIGLAIRNKVAFFFQQNT